jgi:hypothetical protein
MSNRVKTTVSAETGGVFSWHRLGAVPSHEQRHELGLTTPRDGQTGAKWAADGQL